MQSSRHYRRSQPVTYNGMTDRWLTGLLTAIGMFLTTILGLTLYLLKTTADSHGCIRTLETDVASIKSIVQEVHDAQSGFVSRIEWEKAEQRNETAHLAIVESIRIMNDKLTK